jgi:hypothetical protein
MLQVRNKHIAVVIAAVALALGVGFVPSSGASTSPQAQTACKKATIGGKRKCIAAGQFCARRYENDYNRYGYTCSKRDRNGRYHLKKL